MVTDVIVLEPVPVKSVYESNPDTNAFTDALLAKLGGIEELATADQTGPEIVALLEALAGNARLDYNALKNLPVIGGASSFEREDLGNGAWAFTDTTGQVTFSKNATDGLLTFTIPDGSNIRSGAILVSNTDSDANNDFFLQLNYGGTRAFNQSISTALVPDVAFHNGKASPSQGNPNFIDLTKQKAITAVGSNNIEYRLVDVGSIAPSILITFTLNV